jgi:hypothetical protein
MSSSEEGTTDFRRESLKDLLESQEGPSKDGGGGKNRQMALIGGGIGAVLVVILAVVLLGGGGDDGGGSGSAGAEGTPAGLEMKPAAVVGVEAGKVASICDTASGPVAEGVTVRKLTPAKSNLGQDIVRLEVLVKNQDDLNKLGATQAKSTWRAFAAGACPPLETTTTTPPATEAPASTPPDSVPTPPPTG